MTCTSDVPPVWLCRLFTDRGGDRPRLLRRTRTSVWSDGLLVAKLYLPDPPGRATREQFRARSAGRFVPVVEPLGVDADGANTIGWWRYLDVTRAASPVEATQWLRRLHDRVPVPSNDPAMLAPAPPTGALSAPVREFVSALAPLLAERDGLLDRMEGLPRVFVHGDANPTNVVVTADGTVTGVDFAWSGAGPRVFDVATVATVAVESGQFPQTDGEPFAAVASAYGSHEDVSEGLLEVAAQVVAVNRALACAWVPQWLGEGWARLEAFDAGRPFVFDPGDGPK